MNTRRGHIALVAFDLDGTLLRGDTVCEALARRIGHLGRMKELEGLAQVEDIKAGREKMAAWYKPYTFSELCSFLTTLQVAPGVQEGFQLLKHHGIKIAIISITWEFAVEWFARHLGADYYVGTRLSATGQIDHFWSQDKPRWLARLARRLDLGPDKIAAVGDSSNDIAMLRTVGHPFFVGRAKPDGLENVAHFPDGDIHEIAQRVISVSN